MSKWPRFGPKQPGPHPSRVLVTTYLLLRDFLAKKSMQNVCSDVSEMTHVLTHDVSLYRDNAVRRQLKSTYCVACPVLGLFLLLTAGPPSKRSPPKDPLSQAG